MNAADPDPNADPLTYTLTGTDAALFRVRQDDTGTPTENEGGQIEVAAGTKLDYEMKQTYMVTVMAEDSFGATASIDVTIMVTDLDEAPDVSGAGSIPYAENGMGRGGDVHGDGPRGYGDHLMDAGRHRRRCLHDRERRAALHEVPRLRNAGGRYGHIPSRQPTADDNTYEIMVKAMDRTGKTGMKERDGRGHQRG